VDVGTGVVSTASQRYAGDAASILGLYNKGLSGGGMVGGPLDGHWTRGSSYSDIRNMGYHHRADPVYEEIEKPGCGMSPRASVSDLSEDEGHLYPHDMDLYHRNKYGQQVRSELHIIGSLCYLCTASFYIACCCRQAERLI